MDEYDEGVDRITWGDIQRWETGPAGSVWVAECTSEPFAHDGQLQDWGYTKPPANCEMCGSPLRVWTEGV